MGISCTSPSVRSDYDPQSNFVTYRTFAVLERPTANPSNLLHSNPPAVLLVEESVTNELIARSYRKVKPTDADFLVAYHGGQAGAINVQRWGYTYGPRNWYGERNLPEQEYDQAALIIDIIDARSRQLVWRGWSKNVISSPQATRGRVPEVVERILAEFPPEN
jgi:hypothetical protein